MAFQLRSALGRIFMRCPCCRQFGPAPAVSGRLDIGRPLFGWAELGTVPAVMADCVSDALIFSTWMDR